MELYIYNYIIPYMKIYRIIQLKIYGIYIYNYIIPYMKMNIYIYIYMYMYVSRSATTVSEKRSVEMKAIQKQSLLIHHWETQGSQESSHPYLYSAFNNTNCVKATAQYQNRKIVSQ